jgi:hypothetical protein
MAGLKRADRPVEGRCARCRHLSICGGNSRTRAWQLTGNPWAEDPGCYLSNEEIGIIPSGERIELRPYDGRRRALAQGAS